MLLPYQVNVIKDKSRFKLVYWFRGARKTFTMTLGIVIHCYHQESLKRATQWVILSGSERQSKEAIGMVKRHCQAFSLAFGELTYPHENAPDFNVHEIRLGSGSRILGIPANPDTVRGFSANVYLDEFQAHRDSRAIWAAMFPSIRERYKLWVSGTTPRFKTHKFYDLITTETDLWSRHVIDVHQAVADGHPLDIAQTKAALDDDLVWAQEYELQFIDANDWLPFEMILACEDEQAGKRDRGTGATYIGIDVARTKHLWVAWVWETIGDIAWCREIRVLKNALFEQQTQVVGELITTYNPVRIAVDQSGIGRPVVEGWQRQWGAFRIEGVDFTLQSKQYLSTLMRQRFERRGVRIPRDPLLRADLASVKRIVTPAGNVRFDVDSDASGLDSHADRYWAAALGLYAIPTQKPARKARTGSVSAWG